MSFVQVTPVGNAKMRSDGFPGGDLKKIDDQFVVLGWPGHKAETLAVGDLIWDRKWKLHFLVTSFAEDCDGNRFVLMDKGLTTKNKYAPSWPTQATGALMPLRVFAASMDGGAYGPRGYWEWIKHAPIQLEAINKVVPPADRESFTQVALDLNGKKE